MTEELTLKLLRQVVESVAPIILPLLAVMIVRYVKQEWKRLHIPEWVITYSNIAIHAAEQSHILSKDKKQYAIEALQALLDTHGVKLDAKALDAAIEDAVHNAELPHQEPNTITNITNVQSIH